MKGSFCLPASGKSLIMKLEWVSCCFTDAMYQNFVQLIFLSCPLSAKLDGTTEKVKSKLAQHTSIEVFNVVSNFSALLFCWHYLPRCQFLGLAGIGRGLQQTRRNWEEEGEKVFLSCYMLHWWLISWSNFVCQTCRSGGQILRKRSHRQGVRKWGKTNTTIKNDHIWTWTISFTFLTCRFVVGGRNWASQSDRERSIINLLY